MIYNYLHDVLFQLRVATNENNLDDEMWSLSSKLDYFPEYLVTFDYPNEKREILERPEADAGNRKNYW